MALPFADSRRLTGSNLFFDGPGAILECGDALSGAVVEGWRARVLRARAHLGWPAGPTVVRPHAAATTLALAAPFDQLFTATEVNEWALCAALCDAEPARCRDLERLLAEAESEASEPAVLEEAGALARLARLAAQEAQPALRRLVSAAAARGVPVLLDDAQLTLGAGTHGRSWPLASVPQADAVDWSGLGTIPIALVTGSNGKTTTVRLIAACATEHGWRTGYSCTDGLFVAGERIETGDYSGPVGARTILRDRRVDAAVLETARGGILRRGLAVDRADVAIVTNVSSDHFGEYGIDDIDALADAKLVLARAIGADGVLVLNADDPVLRAKGATLRRPLAWFALEADHPVLTAHRANGGVTCAGRSGRLWLQRDREAHDLGAIADMPLTVDGTARYNVANLGAAALGANALGIPPATIARVLARFGAAPEDNPGRLMRFEIGGAHILVDYAHNPAGLTGLLEVAERLRHAGRLALLLGHAGNRTDADLEQLAAVAAAASPDLIIVKEIDGYQRGRPQGEIARILRAALLRRGLPEASLPVELKEVDAARRALGWVRPGDVLALLVHSLGAREAVLRLLERLRELDWRPGEILPID
jgi:cyanophycin synthetase